MAVGGAPIPPGRSPAVRLVERLQRLALDYRNKLWGKWRPSAAARSLGGVALQLELLISRDGHSLAEAVEILKVNHQVGLDREVLEHIACQLPARLRRRNEGVEALQDLPAEERADDALWRVERKPAQGDSHEEPDPSTGSSSEGRSVDPETPLRKRVQDLPDRQVRSVSSRDPSTTESIGASADFGKNSRRKASLRT